MSVLRVLLLKKLGPRLRPTGRACIWARMTWQLRCVPFSGAVAGLTARVVSCPRARHQLNAEHAPASAMGMLKHIRVVGARMTGCKWPPSPACDLHHRGWKGTASHTTGQHGEQQRPCSQTCSSNWLTPAHHESLELRVGLHVALRYLTSLLASLPTLCYYLLQVRLLKQKVADAEEEQLRAEEEAAQLRQEVAQQQQQQQLAGGAVGNASAGAAGSARDSAARSRAAEEGLRTAQLEAQAAKAEAARLQQELQAVKQQAQHTQTQLQAQLHELAQQQQQHGKQPPLHTHAAAASQEQQQQLVTELASCREQISTLQQTLSAAEAAVAAAKMEAAAARAEAGKAAAAAARGGAALVSAAGAVGNGSDAEAEALQEQIELLMDKVVTLKKSRDKLLEQLDGQSVEMEQLLAEHQVGHRWRSRGTWLCEHHSAAISWNADISASRWRWHARDPSQTAVPHCFVGSAADSRDRHSCRMEMSTNQALHEVMVVHVSECRTMPVVNARAKDTISVPVAWLWLTTHHHCLGCCFVLRPCRHPLLRQGRSAETGRPRRRMHW